MPFLVKQARHVVFLHEGTGGGQVLRGELLGRDAGAKDILGRADGGDRAALLGSEGLDTLHLCGRGVLFGRRDIHFAMGLCHVAQLIVKLRMKNVVYNKKSA